MRAILSVLLSALAFGTVVPPAQAQNVSISATITGEIVPGVYGHVVLGNRPPPPLVYAQPVVAVPVVVVQPVPMEPIYLHVPPGHAKNWRKHCHEYNACNRPVYFVRSAEYEPGYRPERGEHDHAHHGDRGNHGHGDEDRGDDHGHGHHDD
jgi:hypothetical protein